jgi:hypothetical protein
MKESEFLREQAKECRSAAMRNAQAQEARGLRQLARYYDEQAEKLERPTSRH